MCSHRRTRHARPEAAGPPAPGANPDMRASDADREAMVQTLRDHGVAGRLSTEELEERTSRALQARTFGELEALLADLPPQPDRRRAEAREHAARRGFREHLRSYVMVMTLLVVIWALTGMGYFWPIWPMVGWGIGIASHAASVPRRRRARAPDGLVGA